MTHWTAVTHSRKSSTFLTGTSCEPRMFCPDRAPAREDSRYTSLFSYLIPDTFENLFQVLTENTVASMQLAT